MAVSRHLTVTFTVLLILALPSLSWAAGNGDNNLHPRRDTLVIPVGKQGAGQPAPPLPARGDSQEKVRRDFGEPLHATGPVGSPPISVWRYGEFAVYFEGNRVLHSVVPHRPGAGQR